MRIRPERRGSKPPVAVRVRVVKSITAIYRRWKASRSACSAPLTPSSGTRTRTANPEARTGPLCLQSIDPPRGTLQAPPTPISTPTTWRPVGSRTRCAAFVGNPPGGACDGPSCIGPLSVPCIEGGVTDAPHLCRGRRRRRDHDTDFERDRGSAYEVLTAPLLPIGAYRLTWMRRLRAAGSRRCGTVGPDHPLDCARCLLVVENVTVRRSPAVETSSTAWDGHPRAQLSIAPDGRNFTSSVCC